MARQPKPGRELERIIADYAGFDDKKITVVKVGRDGDFDARVTGSMGWVTKARAQSDVNAARLKTLRQFLDGNTKNEWKS